MKTTMLLSAMLTLALTVNAQSAHRSTKPADDKKASTETRTVRSASAQKQGTASNSRNEAARPNQTASTSRSQHSGSDRPAATVNKGNGASSTARDYKRPDPNARNTDSRHVQSSPSANTPKRTTNQTVYRGQSAVDPRPAERHVNNPMPKQNDYHYVYPKAKSKYHYHMDTRNYNYKVRYYPRHADIIWTRGMHKIYLGYYPWYTGWHYHYGYRIRTMSSFDASFNIGEVARVYGRVYATWYNNDTDDYLLFFGGEFPYQHLTVIIPGKIARRYSWRPENYFLGQHVTMTGLITSYEGKPEIVIHSRSQFSVY